MVRRKREKAVMTCDFCQHSEQCHAPAICSIRLTFIVSPDVEVKRNYCAYHHYLIEGLFEDFVPDYFYVQYVGKAA